MVFKRLLQGLDPNTVSCPYRLNKAAAVVQIFVASPTVTVTTRSLRVSLADQLANFGIFLKKPVHFEGKDLCSSLDYFVWALYASLPLT